MADTGPGETSVHVLLVVTVATADAEYAADILWAAGAQAVEEIDNETSVALRTDLGSDPLTAWAAVVAKNPLLGDWSVRTDEVDACVADNWRAHASPTVVGHVRIAPAWLANTLGVDPNDSDPHGMTTVLIEPGGSFGIGDHPTTRATLALALRAPGTNILDLGCGSGVLGVALCLTRRARIVAIDIAPAAVEATRHNTTLNGVDGWIIVEQGDVRGVRGTYDLVLANILAPVLLADAHDIASRVAARGTLILSGFTETRRADIIEAYSTLGLSLCDEAEVDGWLALQFESVE
jgi:ribosomal protein L11 methyltransferase